eukprot:CAMPEP_0168316142 /NCGR_PEP_ID=MMETSP0210-20121227/14589_1 /TAXON_ID=40633 /ORGANISM="Condylostoma magnum, Strain COL2" /LENGTH=72 /DNA_ID=CAMNT_0008295291 /DNA_START=145 /DNA_END=363 /DNA_ORIENTATION=-
MKGDYYRYIAEFVSGGEKDTASNQADSAYTEARKISEESLEATHPTRLGLALNYSVFYYEILGKTSEACEMA